MWKTGVDRKYIQEFRWRRCKMLAKKRYVFIVVIVLLLGLLSVQSVAFGSDQGAGREQGIPRIRAGYITLTEEHRLSPTEVRAFIPTESSSLVCLVTLAESDSAVPGTTVYCGRRVVEGVAGVNIHIFYPDDLPDHFLVTLTLYQDGAKRYGEPVLYTGD
jgi:hypothetical protein